MRTRAKHSWPHLVHVKAEPQLEAHAAASRRRRRRPGAGLRAALGRRRRRGDKQRHLHRLADLVHAPAATAASGGHRCRRRHAHAVGVKADRRRRPRGRASSRRRRCCCVAQGVHFVGQPIGLQGQLTRRHHTRGAAGGAARQQRHIQLRGEMADSAYLLSSASLAWNRRAMTTSYIDMGNIALPHLLTTRRSHGSGNAFACYSNAQASSDCDQDLDGRWTGPRRSAICR